MMKKITIAGLLACFLLVVVVQAAEEQKKNRSWDEEKSKQESGLWQSELKKWEDLSSQWEQKRARLHQERYGDDFDGMDSREYCSEGNCWGEGMFNFTFKNEQAGDNWDLSKEDSTINVSFQGDGLMSNSNDGQVIIYKKPTLDNWESSNFGQVIQYTNQSGDFWESSNFGQVVTFKSADGSSWNSSNFGQVVEHKDANGEVWSGSDSDDINSVNR